MTFNARLSARDRRAAIGGGAVIGALVLGAKVIPAIQTWEEQQVAEATQVQSQVNWLRRHMTQVGNVHRPAVATIRGVASDSSWFVAANVGGVGAQFIASLKNLAAEDDVTLHALQPRLDSTQTRDVVVASARLSLTADVEGLMDFLTDIEADRPDMRVLELSAGQDEPTAPDSHPDVLKVELLIQGLGLVRAAKGHAGN